MAREHAKNARILMATTGTGVPVVVAGAEWTLNMETDQAEVTSFGDLNKTFVTGLKNLQGTFSGFWDSLSDTLFQAADSPTGSLMYLYPDATSHPGWYWYGVANVSASISASATGAVGFSGSFSARASWTRAVVLS